MGLYAKRVVLYLSTVLGGIVLIVGGAILAYALLWRKKKMRSKKEEALDLTSTNDDLERGAGPRRFSHAELAKATNHFCGSRKLGQGGFGAVYRGYFARASTKEACPNVSSCSNAKSGLPSCLLDYNSGNRTLIMFMMAQNSFLYMCMCNNANYHKMILNLILHTVALYIFTNYVLVINIMNVGVSSSVSSQTFIPSFPYC